MGKRKRTHKNNDTPIVLNVPNEMSADDLQHVIAGALVEAEEIRAQKEMESSIERGREWHSVIGYKDYSSKKRHIRWLFRLLNDICILIKLPFIPKSKLKSDWISWSLLQALMVELFQFITWGFRILVLLFIFAAWQQQIIGYIILALVAYALSGVFRIVRIEIEKIEDRNYLISLFAAIAAFITIIITIISIGRGG